MGFPQQILHETFGRYGEYFARSNHSERETPSPEHSKTFGDKLHENYSTVCFPFHQ